MSQLKRFTDHMSDAVARVGKAIDPDTEPHEKQILRYLKNGGTLTKRQALDMFDCWNSGNVIFRLREKGYRDNIKTVMINTYSGKQIARYHWEDTE